MARKKPRKPRTPISELAAKNSPRKKPKTDRTPKKTPKYEGKSPKKTPRKKRAAFPPETCRKSPRFVPESFGEFQGILGSIYIHIYIEYIEHDASSSLRVCLGKRKAATERERERERPGGKSACASLGAMQPPPQQKQEGSWAPVAQAKTSDKKNQTGGGLSPSAREGHTTPCPHSRGAGETTHGPACLRPGARPTRNV